MKKITLLFFTFLASQVGNAQNTCATAVAVTAGTTTVGAINGTVPTPVCAPNGAVPGANNPGGEWYSYTPTSDVVVTITSDLPQNAGGDTRMHIYTGGCGSLTCYASNDDVDDANFLSTATFEANVGTTYIIAWDNRWSSQGFDFLLTEFTPTCDNSVPYTQTFDDNIEFLGCYSREDVDGDGISWISQQDLDLDGDTVPETFATNGNSTTGPKNDWLFSQGFALTGGTQYEVTSIFNTFQGNGSLEAFITDAPISTAATQIQLFSQTNIVTQGVFETLETNAYVQTNTFTPATDGTYYIAYHSFGPASSGFILLFDSNLDSTLSVDEFASNNFSHYYDKNTDVLNLQSSGLSFENIQFYNLLGQEVMNKELSQTSESVDISDFQDGIYIAKVSIEGQVQTVKFLKQ